MGRVRAFALLPLAMLLLGGPVQRPAIADAPWPGFRHDCAHTGRSGSAAPSSGAVAWRVALGAQGTGSPAVTQDRVYAVAGGRLIATSIAGQVLWSAACGGSGGGSPAVAPDGTIYISCTDSHVYAFNPDGSPKWTRAIAGSSETPPTVGPDGTVYVGTSTGRFVAIRPDGAIRYTYTADGAISTSAAIAPDGTAYFGCDDGRLYAITTTGGLRWKFITNPASAVKSSPSIGADGIVYFGSVAGYFYAVYPGGTQKWRLAAGGAIYSSPALGADGSIYFGCRDSSIYSVAPTGILKWRYRTGHYVDSSPAVDCNGLVMAGSYDGSVYAVSPAGTLVWATDMGAAVLSSPAIGGFQAAYVTTYDGYLCALRGDGTPPSMPTVTDDGDFSSSPTELHATWLASDPESGISRYEYSIGTLPGGSDVAPFTDAGPATEVTRSGLALANGARYYFTVRAVNGAGMAGEVGVSDGIVVDSTSPGVTLSNVRVSISEITITPQAVDPESGVTSVQCALLASPTLPATPAWVDVATGQDAEFAGPFDAHSVYYIAARARNGAGLWSAGTISDPISMDSTPPHTPVVTDDGQFWPDSSTLHASWSADDAESGIDHYAYCLGSSAGKGDVVGWTDTDESSVSLSSLSLASGPTYYFSVKAINGAALASPVGSSDGIRVDTSPPSRPIVTDSGEYSYSADCLSAVVNASDTESGVSGYMYCIGTSPSAHDVLAWTTVDAGQAINACGLRLKADTRYFISAKARNGAGLYGAVGVSDGIQYKPGVRVWPKFRCDSRNSGTVSATAPVTGRLLWKTATQGYVESSPAIGADGTVYVGSSDGRLYAINPGGGIRWSCQTGACIDSSPALGVDGSVYVGSYDGLYCVNPNGTQKWKFATGGMVWSSPNIGADGTIYFGCHDRRVYAVSPAGVLKWSYTTGGEVWSSPAITTDGTIYVAAGDGRMYVLTSAGALKWSYLTGSAADSSPAVGLDGTVYFGSGDGYLYALNPDGALKWKANFGQLVDSSAAVTPDGHIYVGTGGAGYAGALYALDTTGAQLWHVDLPGGVRSSPLVDQSGNICFGTANNKVYMLSPQGVTKWVYTAGDSLLSSPALGADGSLVIGSDDGYVYCFRDQGITDTTPPTTPVVTVSTRLVSSTSGISATWVSTDPESGVQSYSYAIGTVSGGDDLVSWTSVGSAEGVTRTDLPLVSGRAYYVSVIARNYASLDSGVGVSDRIVVGEGDSSKTIGSAKKRLAGTQVTLAGKVVVAAFPDCVFIEEPDRSAGIRCMGVYTGLTPGQVVDVQGTVGDRFSEAVLAEAKLTLTGLTATVQPLGMPVDVLSRIGADPLGLIVRVTGRVVRTGTGYFLLDDGSLTLSPRGLRGIEVRTSLVPTVGSLVSVDGVGCREIVASQAIVVVRALPSRAVIMYPLGP